MNLGINETNEIFKSLNELCRKVDLMQFIQEIINSVEIAKPGWVKIRESRFFTLETMIINPTIVYIGHNSLSFDNGAQSEVLIHMRPGARGFSCPGSTYIMSISHNESMQKNYGAYIHRNIKEDPYHKNEGNYSFLKPKILVSDISLYNQEEFSSCLSNAILSDSKDKFHKCNALSHSGSDSGKMLFYISQFNDGNGNKSIIAIAPRDEETDKSFKNSVQNISLLMPFAPSTILVRHPVLQCAVAIRYFGNNLSNNSIYFFNETCKYYPYQININTLNFMINKINTLFSIENQTFIAITGEMLSYPFDSESTISYDSIKRPTVDPKCNTVFSDDSYFFSHMVIISEIKTPGENPINWTKRGISSDYVHEDYITHISNSIFPGFFKVTKKCNRVFFMESNKQIKINGRYPIQMNNVAYSYNNHNRDIDLMFDSFAMGCVQRDTLIRNVDMKSFSTNGIKLDSKLIPSYKNKDLINAQYEKLSNANPIEIQIDELLDQRKQLSSVDFLSLTSNARNSYLTSLAQLDLEIFKLEMQIASPKMKNAYQQIIQCLERKIQLRNISLQDMNPIQQQAIKDEEGQLTTYIKSLRDQYNISFKRHNTFFKNSEEIKIAHDLIKNDFFIVKKDDEIVLDIPLSQDPEKESSLFLSIIHPLLSGKSYRKEVVPMYLVTLSHEKNSKLDKNEFC